jgi:pyruvate dehydrogenase E2 component (dihydrolipoamide acetyltransferase)
MDVKLPQLAEGVESGTVVNILVKEGDTVTKDQAFMELETQKAVGSIPSPTSGVVTKVHVKEGMEVSVGQLLISIDANGGAAATSVPAAPAAKTSAPSAEPTAPALPASGQAPVAKPDDYRYESKSGVPPPASPTVRKIARDLGIDLNRVRGSETGGRIALTDLRHYIERLQQIAFSGAPGQPAASPAGPHTPSSELPEFSKWGSVHREKMSALRRTVSRRMIESWSAIPKIDQFADMDITDLLALRKKYSTAYAKEGAHLTITTFIVKAVASALKKHPKANSSIDEAAQELIFKDYRHIGVAVDTDAGLIVPVIRDADKKSLIEIARDLATLSEKSRQRKISIEELQGGTFTISNQGSIGGSHFTPII